MMFQVPADMAVVVTVADGSAKLDLGDLLEEQLLDPSTWLT